MAVIDELKFDSSGLIPAVVQDAESKEVLMVAYMNAQAFRRTLETGLATYFSRSREQLWVKGETSGHVQKVKSVYVDCDADCILLEVEQVGPACHTNYRSCFYRRLQGDALVVVGEKREA